jgi:uncharacterized membrane protein
VQSVARVIVLGAIAWTLAIFLAPTGIQSSSRVASRTAGLIYAAGGIVCHQRPERSFFRHGRQMPVCARCTGLYVSALVGGIAALMLAGVELQRARLRQLFAIACCPTAVTWVGEAAGLWYPSNLTRAMAAAPLGAAAAWLVITTLTRSTTNS